jgi:DNA replication and repair protein RecF
MLLNQIILRNFRNYIDCKVSFSKPVNLIIGGNAQGKTSLLEAIYFLCTAESHRAMRDTELIRHNESGFYLKGVLTSNSDDVISLEASKRARGQFSLKKNGVLHTKRSEWIGQFNAVFFAPESLILVKGAPAERRRFLDLLIAQIDNTYLQHLQKYQLVLKQRNELLKQIRTIFVDAAQLDAWDKLLLVHGTAVTIKRLEVFHQLQGYAMKNHQKLTGGRENIALTYRSASMRDGASMNSVTNNNSEFASTDTNSLAESGVESESVRVPSASEITKRFGETLSASRSADLQRGTTLVGPHRDDFLIELENQPHALLSENASEISDNNEEETTDELVQLSVPKVESVYNEYQFSREEIGIGREVARAYGSQGQQRTIALALKLAELELIRATTGRNPIVLLDDVTSELDYKRIGYLLGVLQNLSTQTFITATHAEPLVRHLHEPNVLTVRDAQISHTTLGKADV